VDAIANGTKLPQVQTRKELLDHLENAISLSREDDEEPRGRPRELKAYILESEGGFPRNFDSNGITGTVKDTGLNKIKILQVSSQKEAMLEFFLDINDPRFFVLHTNEKSDTVGPIIKALTKDRHYTFDNAWFNSNMLYNFTKRGGNAFNGFGVKYDNTTFTTRDNRDDTSSDIDDLKIIINGTRAQEMLDKVGNDPAIAFNKVRIQRGQGSSHGFIQDDLTYDGYFSVKRGKSVQDHMHLVDICKEEYSETIKHVEESSIGVRTVDDRTLVEGKSFDFEFTDPIEDLDFFIECVFNSSEPFRLWGLKSKVRDGYFKITAVDLHAGTTINFDIANNLMRVYLFKGSCGNTILRLLANLQMSYDSRVTCKQIVEYHGRK